MDIIENDVARRLMKEERMRIGRRRLQRGAELAGIEPRISLKYFAVGGFPRDTSNILLAAFFSTRALWRTSDLSCVMAFEASTDVTEATILARDFTFEGYHLYTTVLQSHDALRRIGGGNALADDIPGPFFEENSNVEQLMSVTRGLTRQSALRVLDEAGGDVNLAAARVTEWNFAGGAGEEAAGDTPTIEDQKEALLCLANLQIKGFAIIFEKKTQQYLSLSPTLPLAIPAWRGTRFGSAVEDQMKCICCQDIPEGMTFSCANGHIICSSDLHDWCRVKEIEGPIGGSNTATCPTCREDLTNIYRLSCVDKFVQRVNDKDEQFKKEVSL